MQKLADRVYCKMDPDGRTNVGVVDIGEHLVFIDTTLFPYTTREALADAKAIVNKPFKYLVNTHFHSDHTFGNQEFSCTIVAQKDCPRLMKTHLPGDLRRRIQTFTGEAKKRLEEVKLTYPTMTFDREMKLIDDPEIRLVHLGGHTPDSTAVLLPEAKVVFAGDLLFVGYHPMLEDADLDGWINALKRMKSFEARIVVPGHGSLTDASGIQEMITYLQTFKDNLSNLKKKGHSKKELTEKPSLLSLPERRRPERIAPNVERFYDKI